MPRSPSGLRLPTPQELIVPKPPGMEQGMLPSGKPSQKGWSKVFPRWDLHNPHQFEQVTRNLVGAHDLIKHHFPEEHAAGLTWHQREHEGIARALRGVPASHRLSHLAGSAITASVSAGTDWEGQNVHVLGHVLSMPQKHWDVINKAHAAGGTKTAAVDRIVKGTPLESTTVENLHRAGRIRAGEHPLDVINPKTAPKEHAFTMSLHQPDVPHPATIDFRAHDLAINRMYPAQYSGRGIQSSHAATGVHTRYEKFTHGYEAAAHARDIELPHQFQAATWLGGKRIETLPPLKSGGTRTKGVMRRGQPYFHQEG